MNFFNLWALREPLQGAPDPQSPKSPPPPQQKKKNPKTLESSRIPSSKPCLPQSKRYLPKSNVISPKVGQKLFYPPAQNRYMQEKIPGRNYIRPPPPFPHFWPKGIFQGRGVGVYIWRPHAAGILYAPPFYTPPTPRRVFSGVGGWGCIKFGPVKILEELIFARIHVGPVFA